MSSVLLTFFNLRSAQHKHVLTAKISFCDLNFPKIVHNLVYEAGTDSFFDIYVLIG